MHPAEDPTKYPSSVHEADASPALAILSPNFAAAAIVFNEVATVSQADPLPPS